MCSVHGRIIFVKCRRFCSSGLKACYPKNAFIASNVSNISIKCLLLLHMLGHWIPDVKKKTSIPLHQRKKSCDAVLFNKSKTPTAQCLIICITYIIRSFLLVMFLSINVFLTFSANSTRNFTNLKISTVYRRVVYLLYQAS